MLIGSCLFSCVKTTLYQPQQRTSSTLFVKILFLKKMLSTYILRLRENKHGCWESETRNVRCDVLERWNARNDILARVRVASARPVAAAVSETIGGLVDLVSRLATGFGGTQEAGRSRGELAAQLRQVRGGLRLVRGPVRGRLRLVLAQLAAKVGHLAPPPPPPLS